MSQRPRLTSVELVVMIYRPGRPLGQALQPLASCALGTIDGEPADHAHMVVDVAKGVGPDVIMPIFKTLAEAFGAQDLKGENNGVPVNPLTGEPVQ